MKVIPLIFIFMSISNLSAETKKAIVIGASSGMGRQVAKELAKEGYEVGLTARRTALLDTLAKEIATKTYKKNLDASQYETSVKALHELIDEMGGLDVIVISISATNDNINDTNTFANNQRTLNVDLLGFWYLANAALEFFERQGHGHLVGISSTAGLIGDAKSPVYCGAKAFIQRYLEATRNRMIQSNKKNIFITDIIPGWVEVEAEDIHQCPGAYWIAKTDEAARQIVDAIKKKKEVAYITARWEFIAMLYKICPNWLYNWIGGF